MQPLRTGRVAAQGDLMKNKCERTKKALPAYLRGHVFLFTRNRIDRHLHSCVICRSEFEALKSMEETRQILKYIDSPEGVAQRVKEGVFALAKFKKLLYRPLWLAGIALVAAGVYYYAMLPRELDLEIDSIVKTAPAATTPVREEDPKTASQGMKNPVAGEQKSETKPVTARDVAPLAVSITPSDERSSIQQVNEVMSGHGELRKMKFSNTERQLSGKLTAQELRTFFDRMGELATVYYDRKLFRSFPAAEQIPFVLTLKEAPPAVEKPIPAPQTVKSAETHMPAETAAPAPLVSAPATSATK